MRNIFQYISDWYGGNVAKYDRYGVYEPLEICEFTPPPASVTASHADCETCCHPRCQRSPSNEKARKLLGKRVRVRLDTHVIVTGKLLAFADDGEFEILDDDGETVHYAWPMLEVTEATGGECE